MIGIPMMAVLLSPMECLTFAPGHSKDLGRTFDNSLEYSRILMGIPVDQLKCVPHHSAADAEKRSPWCGQSQGLYHERVKQWLAKLQSARGSPPRSPKAWQTLPESPWGKAWPIGLTNTLYRKAWGTWSSWRGRWPHQNLTSITQQTKKPQEMTSPGIWISTTLLRKRPMHQLGLRGPPYLNVIITGIVLCIRNMPG